MSRPTCGSPSGAPHTHTPSQAEFGLEGVFVLTKQPRWSPRSITTLLLLALILGGVKQGWAAPFTVTDMGFSSRSAPAINNNSQVSDSRTVNGQSQALLWENGNITDLGTLPGDQQSNPHGINDASQIVGQSDERAFLWENGVMNDLGALPGNSFAGAFGINNLGQVVGVSRGGTSSEQAFIWDNGVMSGLGTLGGLESTASGINDFGQVIGSSRTTTGASST